MVLNCLIIHIKFLKIIYEELLKNVITLITYKVHVTDEQIIVHIN